MSRNEVVEQGIELLKLCHKLQSEKDGVARPEPFVIDKSKTLDTFGREISQSITYMASLRKLLPMEDKLVALGRKLEAEGKINVDYGNDYAAGAVDFILSEHGLNDGEEN